MKANSTLVETLQRSEVYQRYARAYTETTGLPITLRSLETWKLPLHGQPKENPFCAMVADTSRTCAKCLQMQQKLSKHAALKAFTMTCPYGLSEAAVPVKMGTQTVGLLQTGQVLRETPTNETFDRIMAHAAKLGVEISTAAAREAYFRTPVVSRKRLECISDLLQIFADHLAVKSNQIVLHQTNRESPRTARARKIIEEQYSQNLSLAKVAGALNMSVFYFCKLFRKETGLTFTAFLSRTRVDKARNLLLNPHVRISETAYAVGFKSLTHFNRTFKAVSGESPTQYRAHLSRA